MTPAGQKIAAEIADRGPMRFSRFMEIALYDAESGYYRVARDPFGIHGDFFTAAQLQPVFGRLVAAVMRRLKAELSAGDEFTVVEWGSGRGDMEEWLREFNYTGVDFDRGTAPREFTGVAFSNELFDALPVDVARRESGRWMEMRVALSNDRFVWVEGDVVEPPPLQLNHDDDIRIEVPVRIYDTLAAMEKGLRQGWIVAIDYGFTERERIRFPQGTLMSYREHRALEDVLADPGTRDITAHVPFDLLFEAARARGLAVQPLQSLSQWILSIEEPAMTVVLRAESEAGAQKLRLQLKTLLVGMGETFRVAVFRRP